MLLVFGRVKISTVKTESVKFVWLCVLAHQVNTGPLVTHFQEFSLSIGAHRSVVTAVVCASKLG